MSKKLVLISLILLLSGCAFLNARKADWEACAADADCRASAHSWQEKTETVSTVIASAVPVPGAAAAPKVIGYGSFALAMLIGGHLLRKKEEAKPIEVK